MPQANNMLHKAANDKDEKNVRTKVSLCLIRDRMDGSACCM